MIFPIDAAMLPVATTFLFVFALVFGLLTSLGEQKFFKNNKVNAAIAAVFGIFSATYAPLVEILQQYIPIAALLLIVVFFIAFVKKSLGGKGGSSGDKLPMMVTLAMLLLIIGVFWNDIARFLPVSVDSTVALWVIGIIVILMIFWGAYKHSPPAPK